MTPIQIYTDASISHDSKKGAWAAILVDPDRPDQIEERCGSLADGLDSYDGEIDAIMNALSFAPPNRPLVVFTDNLGIARVIAGGRTNSTKRKSGARLSELDGYLRAKDARLEWVRGHAGHPLNSQADRLARAHRRQAEQGLQALL